MLVQQFKQGSIFINCHAVGQFGGGPHAHLGVAFHDHQFHRSITMDLHDDGAIELDIGRQQRSRCHHFAEHLAHRRRIAAAHQHLLPRVWQFNQFAAHCAVLEHEFAKGICHYPIRFNFSRNSTLRRR